MANDAPPIRVLVVDDHPVFRHGLRDILDSGEGVECVGECASSEEALMAVPALTPDIILMDIRMPGRSGKSANGFEATTAIRSRNPQVKVIILSMIDSAEAVREAFNAGANGYLIKDAEKGELMAAIREVMKGGTPISPHIRELSTVFLKPLDGKSAGLGNHDNTERMREVMELLAQGLTNDEIARRLVLAPKTIRNYVSRVIQNVNASSRRDAITKLRESGYGQAGRAKPFSPHQ